MPSERPNLPYETHERLRQGLRANRHLALVGYEVAEFARPNFALRIWSGVTRVMAVASLTIIAIKLWTQ